MHRAAHVEGRPYADVEVNIYIAGVIAGWEDPLDPTEAEMKVAPEIFTQMLTHARFIWTDSTQLEQAWAAGDVGISYIYGSASRRMPFSSSLKSLFSIHSR